MEREAAQLLSEFFCTTVLGALESDPPRTILFGWEQRALDYLRGYIERESPEGLNYWTYEYITKGPPPWQTEI